MEYLVGVYEGLSLGEDVFLAEDSSAEALERIYDSCGFAGDPQDHLPVAVLELVAEDDGAGLYYDGRGQYIWLRLAGGGEYEAASKWLDNDPRVEAAVEAIENASTLDELADALNAELAPAVKEQVYGCLDLTSLPTFGGDAPESGTAGVWSWGERRVLVGDSGPFEIVSRREWEARGE